MYCNYCGKEIPDGARFCNGCGKQLPAAREVPQHPPAPQIHVTTATSSAISPAAAGGGIAGLSALIVLFLLLPWCKVSESLAWLLEVSSNQNVFQIMGFMFKIGYEDSAPGVFLVAVLLLVFIVMVVLFQGATIINGVNLAIGKQEGIGTSATMAGLFMALLCVIVWIAVGATNSVARDEVYVDLYSLGFCSYFCLFLAILQIILASVFDKLLAKKLAQKYQIPVTTCPHCGTSYEKLTAATRCPGCHKLPGDPVSVTPKPVAAPKTDTMTCPFCKTVYPKGTVFCDKCKAQIGSVAPPKPLVAFCSGCGRKLSDGDAFCPGCGKRL